MSLQNHFFRSSNVRYTMFKYLIYIMFCIFGIGSTMEQGEFEARVSKHESCRGPKRKNCTKSVSTLEGEGLFKLDIVVLEDITVIRGKMIGVLDNNELLRVNFKNACENIFLKPVFQMLYNETDRCGVFKGHHMFRLNIPDLIRKFYGGKSIYGNWTFSTLFYNDYCNVHCDFFNVIISPKKSSTKRTH